MDGYVEGNARSGEEEDTKEATEEDEEEEIAIES